MLYFFIHIPGNEVHQLQKKMPKGSMCLIQMQTGSSRYYGVMKEDAKETLMHSLSPESLDHLEMLDKAVFRLFFLQNIGDTISCVGNRSLLMHLSDENG